MVRLPLRLNSSATAPFEFNPSWRGERIHPSQASRSSFTPMISFIRLVAIGGETLF
jgi:hypothetical protein